MTGAAGRGGLSRFGGPVPGGRPLLAGTGREFKAGLLVKEDDAGVGTDAASGEDEREEDE